MRPSSINLFSLTSCTSDKTTKIDFIRMTYSIKRLRNKGDYSLTNLQSVDSLDLFVSEVNKATRLWIDNLDVFVRCEDTASHNGYIRVKCAVDQDYHSESSQILMFYGKDITLLTSTIERVFFLPDPHQHRVIELIGPTVDDTYIDLIFSPKRLRSMLSTHGTRSYMFVFFNISSEQSVLLAANDDLHVVRWCSASDDAVKLWSIILNITMERERWVLFQINSTMPGKKSSPF